MSDLNRFKYDEISNKVLQSDKRFTSKTSKDDAAISQPKSLRGRISKNEMGSSNKTAHENRKRPNEDESAARQAEIPKKKRKQKRGNLFRANLGEGINYVATTEETQKVYDDIFAWVSHKMGDAIPDDVKTSAVDVIISTLKSNKDSEPDFADIFDTLEKAELSELKTLVAQLTDFNDNIGSEVREEGMVDADSDNSEDEESDEESDYSDDDNDNKKATGTQSAQVLENETIALSSDAAKSLEVPLQDIDLLWLQKEVNHALNGPGSEQLASTVTKLEKLIADSIESNTSEVELKRNVLDLFKTDDPTVVRLTNIIVVNRSRIYFRTKMLNAKNEMARIEVISQMNDMAPELVEEFESMENHGTESKGEEVAAIAEVKPSKALGSTRSARKYAELSRLEFSHTEKVAPRSTIKLPSGSYKKVTKNYEEVHIPAPARADMSQITSVPISSIPEWAQVSFQNTDVLNPVQSAVFNTAFETDSNMLLCAPTGAGKTNVAMLTVLRAIERFRDPQSGELSLDKFKMVYIAPLKALVQEQVREFRSRLQKLGVSVGELTGDASMSSVQIRETQLLVCTPEKWDVISRKRSDTSYTNKVVLIIIDEIHLLHDERGPVLESIVARAKFENRARIVGLSATLPNYMDVAKFIAAPEEAVFYFGPGFRPCPLEQQFIGVSDTKAFKRAQSMNDACYDKVKERAGVHQMIVFVHSRKDTAATATYLKDALAQSDDLAKIMPQDLGSQEILVSESKNVQDDSLKQLLTSGIGIHHAGLSAGDRAICEDLFAEGYLQILVSTATLAWGVNLPAHTVIIKGTQVYDSKQSSWTELSTQDVLQMLGRAGRPRYDKTGEGIIITSRDSVQYYLAVLNQQLPIESQLVSRLTGCLNAEVVSGTVASLSDAVNWLQNTYLFQRMMQAPDIYHVNAITESGEPDAVLNNLAFSALQDLSKANLVAIEDLEMDDFAVSATEIGRIAAYYYIEPDSIANYVKSVEEDSGLPEILRIFAQSSEFQYVSVRPDEKSEVSTLRDKVPVPIKELADDPIAKIIVLFQAYVSRLKLDGFALVADMVYVTQSATRLLRALYELCLWRKWTVPARASLELAKSVEMRAWSSNSSFRQFPDCPKDIIRNTERTRVPWVYYLSLTSSQEAGQAVGSERLGGVAFELIKKFPKLKVTECSVSPITPSLIEVKLVVTPDFVWDTAVHGSRETFVVFVENATGDKILHNDRFVVSQYSVSQDHELEFMINLPEKDTFHGKLVAPVYFVSFVSEKWLNCETRQPLELLKVKLPKKFSAPVQLIDNIQTSFKSLLPEFADYFISHGVSSFNKFQNHVFDTVYGTQENVFLGSCKDSNQLIVQELALFSYWKLQRPGRCVVVCWTPESAELLYRRWHKPFKTMAGGKNVTLLGRADDPQYSLVKMADSHVIICCVESWNAIMNRWKRFKKLFATIELVMFQNVNFVGNGSGLDTREIGKLYEQSVTNFRFALSQIESPCRVLAFGAPVANARDFAQWFGVEKNQVFNFAATDRVVPVEVHINVSPTVHYETFLAQLTKQCHELVKKSQSCVIFVSTRSHCIALARSLIALNSEEAGDSYDFNDKSLGRLVSNGFAVLYEKMSISDLLKVLRLFDKGEVKTILATRGSCTFVPAAQTCIVLGTQWPDKFVYRDYTATEVVEMLGCASLANPHGYLFTTASKKEYYRKFVTAAVPVESVAHLRLSDFFVSQLASGLLQSKQSCFEYLSHSLLYKRLQLNPSYYGAQNVTVDGLSEHLSELIDDALSEMAESELLEIETEEYNESQDDEVKNDDDDDDDDEDDERIDVLEGGVVASHYGIEFATMQILQLNLKASKFQLRHLLEIASLSAEFEHNINVRSNDLSTLRRLYNRVPMKPQSLINGNAEKTLTHSVALKVFLLLQAHILRYELPMELQLDLDEILCKILPILHGMVDILAANGNLMAIRVMSMCQFIVQGIWEKDAFASLKQIPFVGSEFCNRCQKSQITNVQEFLFIEDDDKKLQLLGPDIVEDRSKLSQVLNFLNNYPTINDISCRVVTKNLKPDEDIKIEVIVTKDDEEDVENDAELLVHSQKFPHKRLQNWWIVVGDVASKSVYAIRKVLLRKETNKFELVVNLDNSGEHSLNVWMVSDAYYETEEVPLTLQVE